MKFIFAMQRLHLIGKLDSLSAPPYQLEVPSFFHQEKVVQTAKEIADGVKLDIAWGGDKVKSWSLGKSYEPHRNVTFTCYNREEEKNWVNYKLSVHPMPRNLGPIIPVIDNDDDENLKEHGTKLFEKVAWRHEASQECARWNPEIEKDDTFPEYKVESQSDDNCGVTIGPHTLREDMSMVYTCERQMCRVGCSCKICRNQKTDCRRRCREFPCQDCTDQCKIHSLKLDRSFEFKKHEFTLKSNGRDTVKFAIIHAGIFKDCVQCQDDLTDHRNLHRIIHMRCKFCKQIQLPLASGKILTLHEYISAKKIIAEDADLTCSFCNKMFVNKTNRKRHELSVHQHQGKLSCEMCPKKYSNKTALNYHVESEHMEESQKVECDQCEKVFKTETTLQQHKRYAHTSKQEYSCDKCDKKFSLKPNLARHSREKHSEYNVNWDQVGLGESLRPQCDICGNYFKRESNLNIHRKTVHGNQYVSSEVHNCCKCKKVFSSKSNCTRHMRQCQDVVDETEVDDTIKVDEDETRLVSSGTKADKIEAKDEED